MGQEWFSRLGGVATCFLLLTVGTGCEDVQARRLIKEGNDLFRAGEYKAAVEKYNEAEKRNPEIGKLYINRAYAYQQQFVSGTDTAENKAVADGAIGSYKKFLQFEPQRKDVRDLLIQLWLDSRHFDDARNFFQSVLNRDPNNLEAVRTLGVIEAKVPNFEGALKWYERRAEIEPRNPESWYAVGTLIWEQLHNHGADSAQPLMGPERLALADRGIAALEKALRLNDKYTEAYTYANLIYRERAIGHGDTTDPLLGQTAHALADADLKKAKEYFDKAMTLLRAQQAASKVEKEKKK